MCGSYEFCNTAGGKLSWNLPFPSLTGNKGGWEGRSMESCLPKGQSARRRYTGNPWSHSIYAIQVSRKLKKQVLVKSGLHSVKRYHTHTHKLTHLTLRHFLQYCKAVAKLQRDGSVWNFSVCQHVHIRYMQILITLLQVARGKRGGGGMRAGEKKGDDNVRRAAESIKNEMR